MIIPEPFHCLGVVMLWQRLRFQIPTLCRAVNTAPSLTENAGQFAALPMFAQHAFSSLQPLYTMALEQARRQIAERRRREESIQANAYRWN
jgi:hypothetical protein